VDLPDSEVEEFARLCEECRIYEHLQARGGFADRKTVKTQLFSQLLFSPTHIDGDMTRLFRYLWPELFEWITALKTQYGHEYLAILLQRAESSIVIDGVCGRLLREYPEIPLLTIHDSLLAPPRHAGTVKQVMEEEFARHGVRATVKKKGLHADELTGVQR